MDDQRYTSNDVVARTGITPRQLQWWDERGIVVPAREGHRRLYSPDDLAEVAVICELRRKGFSLQRVRKIVAFLQNELCKRLVDAVRANSNVHLLTDGERIFLETEAQQIIDVVKNAQQPMFAVCLGDALRRVGVDVETPIAKRRAGSARPRPAQRRARS